jgi:hypothetical protein
MTARVSGNALSRGLLLDWLAGNPGTTWQQRWQSSEAEVSGLRWRQFLAGWLAQQGHGHDPSRRPTGT